MSRTGTAILSILRALLMVGCGSGRPGAEGAVRSHAAAASLSPAERCEVTVLVLLARTVTAMEDGYSGGIDINQVMARYGEQSPVFRAFAQLDGQVIASVDEHGPKGAIGRAIQRQALIFCSQYGA